MVPDAHDVLIQELIDNVPDDVFDAPLDSNAPSPFTESDIKLLFTTEYPTRNDPSDSSDA